VWEASERLGRTNEGSFSITDSDALQSSNIPAEYETLASANSQPDSDALQSANIPAEHETLASANREALGIALCVSHGLAD
jgi:hypothetical protein